MTRQRPQVHAYTADGPLLVAIHDVLADLYDLLDERLPKPWAQGPVPVKEPAPAGPARTVVPVSEPAPDDQPDIGDEQDEKPARPAPPPLAGRGSSQPAWAKWAADAGVHVSDGMSRDNIITACRSAGVLPEQ